MTTRTIYLILAILGAVLPYSQFVPFVLEHGLDLPLFFEQLFANDISAFFGLDVVVSAIVLLFFRNGYLHKVPLWGIGSRQ